MKILDFRQLNVYKGALKCAINIFEISKQFPREERYSLTDQIRRSSRSVCANIAEAWRKRRYPASFISKLTDADAEAAESTVWLEIASRCDYVNATLYKEFSDHYDHICAQLVRMSVAPHQWCNLDIKRKGQ